MKRYCLLFVSFACLTVWAQGPNDTGTYYQSANGKKGKALKTAMFNIIKNPDVTTYDGLIKAYEVTDKRPDGKVWDMYSDMTNYNFSDTHGNSSEGVGYNREHSFPKSWFNSVKPAYSDIVHVVPCDAYVNNRRSNYPLGENRGETYSSHNSFSKVGKCTFPGYTEKCFEPNDEYKGDFARIYFYMVTCYEDKVAGWSCDMLDGTSYPEYHPCVINKLLKWAKNDPVSDKELNRNKGIWGVQQNRNPFVDYPGLEQYIWGDSVDVVFNYSNYGQPVLTPDSTDTDSTGTNPIPTIVEGQQRFRIVASADELETGKNYIIVCDSKNMALSATSKNVRSNVELTTSQGEVVTTVNEAGKPYQLLLDGNAVDGYTLYDTTEGVYLALLGESNNYLQGTQNATTDGARWTITFENNNGNAVITNKAYNNRTIKYNSSSPRFATYTSGQTAVQLYKNVTVVHGDANGDGGVDVFDIVAIANKIMGNASEGFNEEAADMNGDHAVDVYDIVALANMIMEQGKNPDAE